MYDELKKLCSRRNLLLILCVLAANFLVLLILAVNGMYGNQYEPTGYRRLFSEVEGKNSIGKAVYLKEMGEKQADQMTIADFETQRMSMELAKDAEKIAYYEKYLNELESDIRQKYEISIFADTGTFEKKTDEKLLASYEKLHQVPVTYGPSEGISMVDFSASNLLAACLVLFLAVSSIMKEQEDGILPVLRCTKNGRGKFFLRKSIAVWILGMGLCALFLLENLAAGGWLYGLGDLTRPLQSLAGYEAVSFRIPVWLYLVFIWAVRSAALCMIAQFALLCTIWTKKTVSSFGISLALGAIGMISFYGSSPETCFGVPHYMNPVAVLKAAPLFLEEAYINVFGNPVNPVIMIFAAMALAVVFLMTGMVLFRKTEKSEKKILEKKVRERKRPYCASVWGQEVYKLFVLQRGGGLLVLFALLQLWLYPVDYRPSSEEILETIYIRQLEGEFGEKQQRFMENEQARMNQDQEISAQERMVFENKILPLYESLKEKKDAGEETQFILQSGYEKLFGISNKSRDAMHVLLYAMTLVFGCGMYLSMENSGGMVQLIRPTKKGWSFVKRKKQWIAVGYAFAGAFLAWGFDVVWIAKQYGISHLGSPLNWLLEFESWNEGIKIWMYLAMLFLLRIAGGILTCLCILKISEKCKSNVMAMGISLFVFAVPAVMEVLAIPFVKMGSMNAFLDGNAILQSGNKVWLYIVAGAMLLVIALREKTKRN